jgi:hypothetical protein
MVEKKRPGLILCLPLRGVETEPHSRLIGSEFGGMAAQSRHR